MMRIVIVEDEVIAARTLGRMVGQLRPDFEIAAVLQTVEESVEWFGANPAPDLVFMDIHLADGSSFAIFDKAEVRCPVIFTTAYNEYALEAFEVNGIDYLLKPINRQRLEKAIDKFENLGRRAVEPDVVARLLERLDSNGNGGKSHFLVPYKDKLMPLAVADIAYVFAELKIARVVTMDNRSFMLDYSLDELMKNLDQQQFFRANRQYIVAHRAIEDLSVWFSGKLVVNLKVHSPEKIVVSKARVAEFKEWFTCRS